MMSADRHWNLPLEWDDSECRCLSASFVSAHSLMLWEIPAMLRPECVLKSSSPPEAYVDSETSRRLFGRPYGRLLKPICGTNQRRSVAAESNDFAAFQSHSTGSGLRKPAPFTTCPARPSRSWQSWPNRRRRHGSLNSEDPKKGSSSFRGER